MSYMIIIVLQIHIPIKLLTHYLPTATFVTVLLTSRFEKIITEKNSGSVFAYESVDDRNQS